MDIHITMNRINAELLVDALENKNLNILGEQSTDEILWNVKDSLSINNNMKHKQK